MEVWIDGTRLDVPAGRTLAELLEGVAPHLDPVRLMTRLEIDGVAVDGTDPSVLTGWRLVGGEAVTIGTEAPDEFARARRREIPGHLGRIAELLAAVSAGFVAGETIAANRGLAAAARELGLVLELDRQLAEIDAAPPACLGIEDAVHRVGPRLEEAERGRRWDEVATLLADELVPALRATAAVL
jgi:hypothetical protein